MLRLAVTLSEDHRYPIQKFEVAPFGELAAILKSAEQWLNFSLDAADPRRVSFGDLDSAEYLGGNWLEELLYFGLKKDYPRIMANPRLGFGGQENELDLLIVHRNRAFGFECKTSRMHEEKEISYKLDSVGRATAGLFGASMLVSARRLSPGDSLFERARGMKLGVCSHEDLRGFGMIRAWIKHRSSDLVD